MEFDLGFAGLGLLALISLGFGVVAQFVMGSGTRWMWLIAAAGWLVGGLFASEVVWGNMTAGEIQPIIDGLAFDESLLGGLIGGIATVVITRIVMGGGAFHRPTSI
jgi:hypothetical protein